MLHRFGIDRKNELHSAHKYDIIGIDPPHVLVICDAYDEKRIDPLSIGLSLNEIHPQSA